MAKEIRAIVLYSPSARRTQQWPVTLAPGATVLDALQASGLAGAFPDLELRVAPVGIWGRATTLHKPLRDGDRVEIYRPLKADPKLARRERFARQGSRAAGLFASKKKEQKSPGAGY